MLFENVYQIECVYFQIRHLVTVVIPMREITVVEKADNPTLSNAMHITTKSKVCLSN